MQILDDIPGIPSGPFHGESWLLGYFSPIVLCFSPTKKQERLTDTHLAFLANVYFMLKDSLSVSF